MANYMVSGIKWSDISKWDFQLVLEVQGSTNSFSQRLVSSHQSCVRSSSQKWELRIQTANGPVKGSGAVRGIQALFIWERKKALCWFRWRLGVQSTGRTNGLNKPGINLGLKLEENLCSKKLGHSPQTAVSVGCERCLTKFSYWSCKWPSGAGGQAEEDTVLVGFSSLHLDLNSSVMQWTGPKWDHEIHLPAGHVDWKPKGAAWAPLSAQHSSKDSEETYRKRVHLPKPGSGHEWFMNRKQGYIHRIIYM